MQARPEKGNAPEVAATGASSVKNPEFNQGFNMSNSTEVTTNRAITVPFHGAELYVVEHNGQPYTPMKPVVTAMGLDWSSQHAKLASNQGRWGMVEIAIPSAGGIQSMICLPLRKLFGWLAGINVGKIRESLRAVVTTYQNECDDVLWQYWNDGVAVNSRAFSVHSGQTLASEEADELRHLVESWAKKLSADTRVQGRFIMQAWSKLKSHFKVGYRQIPQESLHEALSIVGRHAAEWEVVDEVPAPKPSFDDAVRLDLAFTLAAQTAAKVQRAVFNGVMSGNADWKQSRYLLNLDVEGRDQEVVARARQVDSNACVAPIDRFHTVIEDSITVDAQTLTQLASTCMTRLSRMAQRAMPATTNAIGVAA